jgi:hypothetical protein
MAATALTDDEPVACLGVGDVHAIEVCGESRM